MECLWGISGVSVRNFREVSWINLGVVGVL